MLWRVGLKKFGLGGGEGDSSIVLRIQSPGDTVCVDLDLADRLELFLDGVDVRSTTILSCSILGRLGEMSNQRPKMYCN